MYCLLKQRRLRWIGHVRMEDDRIPKDLLYGELAEGYRPTGRPKLRFKDVCKRDMKQTEINPIAWETIALVRPAWRQTVQSGLLRLEENLANKAEVKRQKRKASCTSDRPASQHTCQKCGKDCPSRIGLTSHTRRCTTQ